jgi:AMP-binding enzyme C-terminal domain
LIRARLASGFKVWPAEVEATMYGHPVTKGCSIISTPDSYRGEAVKALVVLHEAATASASPDDIVGWARGAMASYKAPPRGGLRRQPAAFEKQQDQLAAAAASRMESVIDKASTSLGPEGQFWAHLREGAPDDPAFALVWRVRLLPEFVAVSRSGSVYSTTTIRRPAKHGGDYEGKT